jgi:ApbE superfamily uncharacterized protein (UPF0280 family)
MHGLSPKEQKNVYSERYYRTWVHRDDLVRFRIVVKESDLAIACDQEMAEVASSSLITTRAALDSYVVRNPEFVTSLVPLAEDRYAPAIVKDMLAAASAWQVGPMAAVAGAVAQAVGETLARTAAVVVVENGGDIFIKSPRPVRMALYAGEASPFSDRVVFEVAAHQGMGVCTSSGVVGPSFSKGRADAVVALASDAASADAAATAIANRIHRPDDIAPVVEAQRHRGALLGLLACCGDQLGLWGDIQLVH